MFKRFFLFALTNVLILVTISLVINLLGIKPYITAQGIDYSSLMAFCLVWGMGGSVLSLLISRIMAKMMMGVKVLEPGRAGQHEGLVQNVHQVAKAAGLPMPEVGIYESPEVNAFATGPSKSRALVAFSSGILRQMNQKELTGVIAHEIAHIKNGDMVTMTLLQGVVNAVVLFLSRIIAFAASQGVKEESRHMVHMLISIVLDILLGILGSVVVMWFSRQREFRADAGSAKLAGKDSMIAALQALGRGTMVADEPASVATLKIAGKPSRFMGLFSSHPSIEERIRRLEA
jgi:heat shock protein HtpX